MEKRIRELFPEIEWIKDKGMQDKVVASYVDALKIGGWEPDDMDKIPFTLLIPNCPFTYLDHVKGVASRKRRWTSSMPSTPQRIQSSRWTTIFSYTLSMT